MLNCKSHFQPGESTKTKNKNTPQISQKWGKMKEYQYVLFTPQSTREKFVK